METSAPPAAPPLTPLSVGIPARDEQASVAPTVEHLHLELSLRGIPHEIVVGDDGSTDATWEVLQTLTATIPELRPVKNGGPYGFGRAVIRGIDMAGGDAVVVMMAAELDACRDAVGSWEKLNEGYEAVCASRFIPGGSVIDYPFPKYVLNRAFNLFIRLLFRFSFNDTTNAFKAYRATTLQGLRP